MTKLISIFIYKFISLLDKIFYLLTKRSFKLNLIDIIEEGAFQRRIINNREIIFFIPNSLVNYRVKNIFNDEPETISWIDNFSDKKGINFWDIGANIGLYSIYASQKHNNINIVSFE